MENHIVKLLDISMHFCNLTCSVSLQGLFCKVYEYIKISQMERS